MEHRPEEPNNPDQDVDTTPSKSYSDEEDISTEELEGLQILADNLVED